MAKRVDKFLLNFLKPKILPDLPRFKKLIKTSTTIILHRVIKTNEDPGTFEYQTIKTQYVYESDGDFIGPWIGDFSDEDLGGPYTIEDFHKMIYREGKCLQLECIIPLDELQLKNRKMEFPEYPEFDVHTIIYPLNYERMIQTLARANIVLLQKDEHSMMSLSELEFAFVGQDAPSNENIEWISVDCLGSSVCQLETDLVIKLYTNLKQGLELIIVDMEQIKEFVYLISELEKITKQILHNSTVLSKSLDEETAACLPILRRKFLNIEPSNILERCKKGVDDLIVDPKKVHDELPNFVTIEQEGFKINDKANFLYEVWSGDMYGDACIPGLKKLLSEIKIIDDQINNYQKYMSGLFETRGP